MTPTPVGTAPANAAAPRRDRILAQTRFETGTLLRNGEQLLVALVLPAMALVGLALSHSPYLGPGRRVDVAVPGVLALAVISTAFTGQAISTAFDRRYGVLRLLGVSPLGRSGLLVAKALAVLTIELLQFVVIGGLGLAFGWHPRWIGLFAAALLTLAGTWTFVALALLLAGTLRAEGVLALANLIWITLLGLGGVIVPPSQMPSALSHLATLLPSGALADGLRAAFIHGRLAAMPLLVLIVWGAVATLLASRTFRWSD
jgi:ABC-2 type transport system permease protein